MPTASEQPPPQQTSPPNVEVSTSAPPVEDESPQLGDELGLCQSFPFDPKVKEMQPILLHLGYYRGALDGCKGPKSVAAVEKFQRDSGLPVTGEVDAATATALQEAKSAKKQSAAKEQ
ncbi:MAG: peptidoglycan-binding domain-containing protein [Terriglobia bacterium]